MPRKSAYSGTMALRGGKNSYTSGKVCEGNYVEDRTDPSFFTQVGATVANPGYVSTARAAADSGVGREGPKKYGAGLPDGGPEIFDELNHTTAVLPKYDGNFPKTLTKTAFSKPSKDNRIEFRTAFNAKPHPLVNDKDALDAYRERWTKEQPGELRKERFETENTLTNDTVVGDIAGQAKRTLRPHAGVPKVLERVKERIMARIAASGGGGGKGDTVRALRRMLLVMDDSGDHKLSPKELEWGLSDYGVELTPDELAQLLTYLDANGDGVIDINEFLSGIRGPMNELRRGLVLQAFAVLDKTGDGVVTVEDLAGAYDTSFHPDVVGGKKTHEEVLLQFMRQWDGVVADGKVTTEEFLAYYDDISAEIERDDYFELMIRNAWHISGGEGAAANTSCRRVLVTHKDGRQTVEEIKNDIGIRGTDIEKMRANLKQQGIDAVKIELYN
jgi:Ca2+-binding EF-hand superfamily protein